MRKYGRWVIVGLALLILIALAVRSSIQSPMTPQASEAWSRGRIIGQMPVKRAVTLQPAPDGGMFLVWPNLDGQLELVHLGVDGEVLLDSVIPLSAKKARDPQLQVGADGRLRLLWREQEGQQAGIHYALLQADGTPVGQSRIISEPGSNISDAPRLVQGEDGRLHALWADDAGIYWAMLDDAGETVAGPTFLIPDASFPMVRRDAEGRLHLAWLYQVRVGAISIYYAALDPEQGKLNTPEEIAEIVVSGPMQLEGVGLGLSQDAGYVFWSDYNARYYRYTFQYACFPLDAPQQRRIVSWELRMGAGPLTIAPLDGQQSPLPVALSEETWSKGQEVELQVALITVGMERDNAPEQFVSATSQASVTPILVADDRSNLHMAWVETAGFGEFRVVYASNAPEVMENYNTLTLPDIVDAALDGLFRLSTVAVSLFASLGMWASIPLIGLVAYHFVTSEETLETRRARAAVTVALVVEMASSFMLPPRIGVDIAWPALRWILPAVSAAVTAAVTASVVRRRREIHLFGAFFLFTIMYSALQTVLFLLF